MDNILFCSVGRRATLLKYFRQSMCGSGKIVATDLSPVAPALFFVHHGFPVEVVSNRAKFDDLVRRSDVCILFYYWRKKWKIGAHFVTVQYKDSKFTGYNTYRTSDGPDDYGKSLEGYIRKQKFYAPFLIAIKDKRSV